MVLGQTVLEIYDCLKNEKNYIRFIYIASNAVARTLGLLKHVAVKSAGPVGKDSIMKCPIESVTIFQGTIIRYYSEIQRKSKIK